MAKKITRREKRLWPIVQKGLEKRGYICHNSRWKFINTGLNDIRADVIGLKEVREGREPVLKLIAVEVKPEVRKVIRGIIDQAWRSNIYAHECYLAIPREFTGKDRDLAISRGIGLIKIKRESKKIEIVLPSSEFNPNVNLTAKVLHGLGYDKCAVCGFYINRFDQEQKYKRFRAGSQIAESSWRPERYICEKCQEALFGDLGQEVQKTQRDVEKIRQAETKEKKERIRTLEDVDNYYWKKTNELKKQLSAVDNYYWQRIRKLEKRLKFIDNYYWKRINELKKQLKK